MASPGMSDRPEEEEEEGQRKKKTGLDMNIISSTIPKIETLLAL